MPSASEVETLGRGGTPLMTDIIPYSEFDPQTKQLSLVNAYWCASAALLVYQPKTVILRDLKSTWGMTRSVYIV